MLLRSSSTPILKSWIPSYFTNSNSSPNNINEPPTPPCLSRTNSITTRTPPSSPSSSPNLNPNTNTNSTYNNHFRRGTTCTPYELELDDPPYPKSTTLQRMFSSSRLDEEVSTEDSGEGDGGGGMDGGDGYGGDGYGGGGGGSGFNNNSNSSSNNNEHGSIEAYYQKMIKANPGDPLLLGNYAKFLKDVRGDLAKAEEYCGRAILASPSDANMLSMYADILWEYRRDGQLAESYFDQAIKVAPENCYIHATYAKFLWDVEEEEVGEEEKQDNNVGSPIPPSPSYMEGLHYQSPTRV
ncbi:uncharacterized protein LOC110698654 [Chenopodium quinoa]|nr:uncharacterized protein LOC110698654 [Chenopodium quinoa]